MAIDISSLLEKQNKVNQQISVDRPIAIDLGNLTLWDESHLSLPKSGPARDKYLETLARDDAQAVINKLCELETITVDGLEVVQLPEGTTKLPRAKHIPKPRQPTKWEAFAKRKGITKNKTKDRNEKLVWDDVSNKWVPRHGYKRAQNEEEKEWLVEVPDQADPNVDYFAKKKEEKKERVAKNEFQRLRNFAQESKNKKQKTR